MTFEDIKKKLNKYNQEHLLSFYNELDDNEKHNLLNQIEKIDFELMNTLYKNKDNFEIADKEISNMNAFDKEKINKEHYETIGIKHIKDGELAVCSMAGGQGTRLGFNGPKGTYMLPLEKPISIFESIINKIKSANEKYGITIYWYIMTSIQNHDETLKFFEDNDFFEYDREHIIFFNQGELPLLNDNGKIVLKDKANVFMAPDGNGGIFKALGTENILKHMEQHGVKYLTIGNVDNILINMIDPIMLGLMIEKSVDACSKSFMKPSPEGKWGVFCKINGKPSVIEYTETPKELLEARNEEGELIFGDAHFGCNTFKVEFLNKVAESNLQMHAALKKNKAINISGVIEEINTYKFEAFIFDIFTMVNDLLIYRVKKDDEFAPIKNKEGDESPKSAVELYKRIYKI